MAGNRIICNCKQVSYIDIRQEMIKGARTLDEIKEMTGAGTGCGRCTSEIEKILASVCGCKGTSLEDVVNAVKNGADTTDKVAEVTGAGSGCGRCKKLIQNIIDLKK
ncbi:MAG: (2Fe-2S)-binding protein [Romboutsia sp.]